jgi:hypothetical protein
MGNQTILKNVAVHLLGRIDALIVSAEYSVIVRLSLQAISNIVLRNRQ